MAIEYTIHPAADVFPMLGDAELAVLAEDIKANGLRDPIVRMGDVILDGRNRWEACRRANVIPQFREVQVADPVAYIVSTNLHRRHLSTKERADIAAKLTNLKPGGDRRSENFKGQNCPLNDEPPPISIEQAAKLTGVSPRSVKNAKKRQRENPESNEKPRLVEKAPDPEPTPEQQQRIDQLAAKLDRNLSKLALLTAQDEAGQARDEAYWKKDPQGIAIKRLSDVEVRLSMTVAIALRPDPPETIPATMADKARQNLRALLEFYQRLGVTP